MIEILYSNDTYENLNKIDGSNMGNIPLAGLTNMFLINPLIDSVSNIGVNKSTSFALEKALATINPEHISYLNSHIMGGQFGYGILKKIPVIKSIFPSQGIKKSWSIKNTEFHHISDLDKQIKDGIVNEKYVSRMEEIKSLLDKGTFQGQSDFLGTGFSFSNKEVNDKVRFLKENIGMTPSDLRKSVSGTVETVTGEDGIIKQNINFNPSSFNRKNLYDDIVNKVDSDLTSMFEPIRKKRNSFDVKKVKEGLGKIYGNDVSKVEEVLRNVADKTIKFDKREKDLLKNSKNFVDDALEIINRKTIKKGFNDFKSTLKSTVKEGLTDQIDDIAKTLTSKSSLEKVLSSKVLRFITGSGIPGSQIINAAGAAIGIFASIRQEKTIENFSNLVLGRQLEKSKDYVYNEASSYSIQNHLNRHNSDLEEYKKIYYYRNTSNELRDEIAPINIGFKNISEFETK